MPTKRSSKRLREEVPEHGNHRWAEVKTDSTHPPKACLRGRPTIARTLASKKKYPQRAGVRHANAHVLHESRRENSYCGESQGVGKRQKSCFSGPNCQGAGQGVGR